MSEQIIGTCDTCKRPIVRTQFSRDADDFHEGCSDFCAVTPEEDRAKFKAGITPGEWALYPCSECGCAIEDEYVVDGWCASCGPKRSARVRGELLQECLPHLPEALRERVSAVLRA